MAVNILIQKFKKSILVLILIFAVIGVGGYYFLGRPKYLAAINVGMSINGLEDENRLSKDTNKSVAYTNLLSELSDFLISSFSSIPVQEKVSSRIGKPVSQHSFKKPIYELTNLHLGFIGISKEFKTKQEAEFFLAEIKNIYRDDVVEKWNEKRGAAFNVQPMENFSSTIVEIKPGIQILILPAILALFLDFVILILWPIDRAKLAAK